MSNVSAFSNFYLYMLACGISRVIKIKYLREDKRKMLNLNVYKLFCPKRRSENVNELTKSDYNTFC